MRGALKMQYIDLSNRTRPIGHELTDCVTFSFLWSVKFVNFRSCIFSQPACMYFCSKYSTQCTQRNKPLIFLRLLYTSYKNITNFNEMFSKHRRSNADILQLICYFKLLEDYLFLVKY